MVSWSLAGSGQANLSRHFHHPRPCRSPKWHVKVTPEGLVVLLPHSFWMWPPVAELCPQDHGYQTKLIFLKLVHQNGTQRGQIAFPPVAQNSQLTVLVGS